MRPLRVIGTVTPRRGWLAGCAAALLAAVVAVVAACASAPPQAQGSSSQRVLGGQLRQAVLVPQPTLEAAAQAFKAGQIDAFATNKAILFELADGVLGSNVLASRWGLEHVAIASGQGRGEPALAYLRQFAESVRAGGQVAAAAGRAGLRGLAPEQAK